MRKVRAQNKSNNGSGAERAGGLIMRRTLMILVMAVLRMRS
jgi:hypothetical protein